MQALPFDRVLVYVPIQEPSFKPGEVNELNADMQHAAFFSTYETQAGETMWAGFGRVSFPNEDLSAEEIGRWIQAQVFDVLNVTRIFDDTVTD